jgi:hypothetical protein
MEWIDQTSYGDLYAFQVLLNAHMTGARLSKCRVGLSLGEVIERFRESGKPFNQARGYFYEDGIINRFIVYKNGHMELAFTKEADAETAAKILLEQPLTPAPVQGQQAIQPLRNETSSL